jgi:tetratricopeptide (TPR) repeat protein
MKLFRTLHCVVLSLVMSANALGQDSRALDEAERLAAASKLNDARTAFKVIVEKSPDSGRAWTGLGDVELQLEHYDLALQAFARAVSLKYRPLVNEVNQARTFAKSGDPSKALAILAKIAESEDGGRIRPFVLSSREFASLRDSAEFQRILEAMAPCKKAEYRQFDFWIGDWDVVSPNGEHVGHNLVTVEQDGCLLVEHWTAKEGGQTGTSFNYYDIRDKKWHQLYLDNSGNAGAFPAMAGALVSNRMVLTTDPSGSTQSRWTWYVTGPGRVRQMAEQSTDAGKTWELFWDSTYVKNGKTD